MYRRWKLAMLVVALLVIGVIGAGWYLSPVAPVATGYAAKNACSGVLVAGRDLEAVEADLPSNPLVPLTRTTVDEEAGSVSSALLGVLWRSTAYHTPGLGCTLAAEDPGFEPLPELPPAPDAPWPGGERVDPPPDSVDVEALERALGAAFDEPAPDGESRGTRAIVVVHDGRIVAERYAAGFDVDTPQIGWSMTKSVGSAIAGRLVGVGRIALDDDELLPEWEGDDRAAITVEHLLTMTDGLAFDETYEAGTDVTNMLFRPGDASAFAASKPLVAEPGERWQYSSGTTNILCHVAARAAGGGPQLARDLVFAPLGMSTAVLEPDTSGDPVCSSSMYASARDWARFGQWFLQHGVWEGTRLLDEDWVERSTTPVAAARDESYGYQWWLNEPVDDTRPLPGVPTDAFRASGHDGQRTVVVPSADVVVVRLGLSPGLGDEEIGLPGLLRDVIAAVGAAG